VNAACLLQLSPTCVTAAAGDRPCCISGERVDRSFDTEAGIECSSRMLAVASFTVAAFNITTSCIHDHMFRQRPEMEMDVSVQAHAEFVAHTLIKWHWLHCKYSSCMLEACLGSPNVPGHERCTIIYVYFLAALPLLKLMCLAKVPYLVGQIKAHIMCSAVTHKLNEVSQIPHWCAIELEHLHIAVIFIPQSCIAGQHLRQDNHLHSIATPHATAVQNSVKWQQTSTFVAVIAAQLVYLAAEFKAHFVTDVRWQCQYAHHRSGIAGVAHASTACRRYLFIWFQSFTMHQSF